MSPRLARIVLHGLLGAQLVFGVVAVASAALKTSPHSSPIAVAALAKGAAVVR